MADLLPDVEGAQGMHRESTPVLLISPDGQPATPMQATYAGSGTLSADGETVEVIIDGAGSAVITVSGAFEGRITFTGAAEVSGGTEGGRLVFKSGVGSTGRNFVDYIGVAVASEYRIVGGGQRVILRASNWVSGSASIHVSASSSAGIVFINGPVHTAEEEAVRNLRGFVSTSGVVAVASGNVLITTLQNPADSGVNVLITSRRFTNDRGPNDENLEFIAYANPTYVPTVLGVSVNLYAGGPSSQSTFRSQVRPIAGLVVGGIQGLGEVLCSGGSEDINFDFIIPPGRGLGLLVQGAGNNLAHAARMSIGLRWYEEAVV